MKVFNKDELGIYEADIEEMIKEGAVFIYPTDTIYGLGCNALDEDAISRVRKIKKQKNRPFSIVVPSMDYIKDNFVLNDNSKQYLSKLPGPLTLILKPKQSNFLPFSLELNTNSVGIRLIDHWFIDYVKKWNIPLVSTSVNILGSGFMSDLDDLDPKIKKQIDFIIYDGPKTGKASKVIKLIDDIKILRS